VRVGESRMVPEARPTSYYGRPVLKEPVWRWQIPAYFFTGGLAAGSAVLGLGARIGGNGRLGRVARLAAVGASAASGGLLVADLGRPARFYNMLRVAKPTSPMSVGSWLLAVFAPATAVAAACDVLGLFPGLGAAAGVVAAALAPAVATYTAVLVSDTAVPAWRDASRELPYVFAGSAAASAGGLACVLVPPPAAGPARRLALAGTLVEVSAGRALERRLDPLVAEPYQQGPGGRLTRLARGSALAGAALLLAGGRRRTALAAGGALTAVAALLERFAVFRAGVESARDPRYTVLPQQRRAAERGQPAVTR